MTNLLRCKNVSSENCQRIGCHRMQVIKDLHEYEKGPLWNWFDWPCIIRFDAEKLDFCVGACLRTIRFILQTVCDEQWNIFARSSFFALLLWITRFSGDHGLASVAWDALVLSGTMIFARVVRNRWERTKIMLSGMDLEGATFIGGLRQADDDDDDERLMYFMQKFSNKFQFNRPIQLITCGVE